MPVGRLRDKVCVITGGTSGIGQAITRVFAAEGAAIAVLSLDEDEVATARAELERAGAPHIAVAGDVADAAAWSALADRVVDRFGRIDVLVNNAGYGLAGTVLDTDPQAWEALFGTNVTGVYLGCRAVLPVMIKAGRGSIVNIASVAGEIGMAERAAYCATKAAVVGLTRAMAVDHAVQGIRVNAVSPGTTDSPYFSKIAPGDAASEEFRRSLADRQLLGRLGRPEEIAAAALFLASDESSFATGSVVTVDGGMSVR
ncbi:SDR family oxidoreductase [Streptomyces sp. RB6PN25]|uniref:SDR family oxidoreductase n=1 Tax=Streptomyces humicola TaxID=2953240 RepID=A0ABT1PT77_9ACTN|nr:glucose 1-dehydrogenase [Streptomyces humicola]MCQ4080883.1 SDR family oxidoreductase [Streptomyces humicola]